MYARQMWDRKRAVPFFLLLALACKQPTPKDAESARGSLVERAEAQPDTIADLIQARVPEAAAGDSGWKYSRRASADLDADGKDESVVLIADVTLDKRGQPLWEDGHRWQMYVEDAKGNRTRMYARFVPNGSVTVRVASPQGGVRPTLVLLEESADHVGVYEFRYNSPGRFDVWRRLDRTLELTQQPSSAAAQ